MKSTKPKRADPLVALDRLRGKLAEVEQDLQEALEHLRNERQRASVDDNELVGPGEVAVMLRCNARTLRRWRHEGRLPSPILIGRTPRWRRGEIQALLEREAGA